MGAVNPGRDTPGHDIARQDAAIDAWAAARSWARSGVMALSGSPEGPPLLPPLSASARLTEVIEEIARLTARSGREVRVSWEAALAGRAAILGLSRNGRTSANGSCRLMAALDGDVALNMPRPDDLSLVPALTCGSSAGGAWEAAARFARATPAAELVERARLLGLAASQAGERRPGPPYLAQPRGTPRGGPPPDALTVVDLSSLWAGPVTARVLCEAGAHVVKVEDPSRPDAGRERPEFYSWIHPRSEITEHVGFGSVAGRQRLRELLESADVVIESSRPRALEQLGLSPDDLVAPTGQIWLSITGHGRTVPGRDWTGFGDDTAVAGGLHCHDARGRPAFCGDATADPATGLVGALAVLRCLADGGGRLVDISMSGVSSWLAGGGNPGRGAQGIGADHGIEVVRDGDGWAVRLGDRSEGVATRPPGLDWI